eukprot:TRINITY_DN8261_c0_g1_i1.p1 TRINITY_DN8261_c0_g1~~TRINITY_DN8261_c0_g1_i1.p1  ORF type:complete len:115 (+),score=11.22 TRINITY_DN8261_c0_g1_i1:147-491(+)
MSGQGVGAIDLAWFAATSYMDRNTEIDGLGRTDEYWQLLVTYWQSLTANGVDAQRYPLEAAWRDFQLGLVWTCLVGSQSVKFGEPNEALITLSERFTYAMSDMGAADIPFERLV